MFLNEEFLKIVVFLGLAVEKGSTNVPIDLKGTGFLFAKQMTGASLGSGAIFLVTAKHVALGLGSEFSVLMNGKLGGTGAIGFVDAQWIFHDDPSIDIALIRMPPKILDYDAKWILEQDFLTDEMLEKHKVGIGDEVQMIGLFSRAPGKSQISPVVRSGAVAMLPKEKVPSQIGDIEAYLVEARSLGGMSGSPVFARSTIVLSTDVGPLCGTGPACLIGVVHGHWSIPVEDEVSKAQHVNLGLALVVPAKFILEIAEKHLSG